MCQLQSLSWQPGALLRGKYGNFPHCLLYSCDFEEIILKWHQNMFQNKKPKSLSFYYALHFISPFKTFCLQILGVILNSILSSYLGCHPFLSVLPWYCTVFFSSKFFLFPCISQGFYPDINNTVSCSLVSNSVTPWSAACQALLSMEFSK